MIGERRPRRARRVASTNRCFLPPHPSAPSREASFALRTGARSQRDAPVDLVAAAFARLDATARRARDDARRNGPASSARPSRAEHVARLRVNPPDAMTMSSVVTPFTGIGAVRAVSRGGAASRVRAGASAASAGARAAVPASRGRRTSTPAPSRVSPQASAIADGSATRRAGAPSTKGRGGACPLHFQRPSRALGLPSRPSVSLARHLPSLPRASYPNRRSNPRKAAAPHHGFSPPPPRNAHFPLVRFPPGDQLTRPPVPNPPLRATPGPRSSHAGFGRRQRRLPASLRGGDGRRVSSP